MVSQLNIVIVSSIKPSKWTSKLNFCLLIRIQFNASLRNFYLNSRLKLHFQIFIGIRSSVFESLLEFESSFSTSYWNKNVKAMFRIRIDTKNSQANSNKNSETNLEVRNRTIIQYVSLNTFKKLKMKLWIQPRIRIWLKKQFIFLCFSKFFFLDCLIVFQNTYRYLSSRCFVDSIYWQHLFIVPAGGDWNKNLADSLTLRLL